MNKWFVIVAVIAFIIGLFLSPLILPRSADRKSYSEKRLSYYIETAEKMNFAVVAKQSNKTTWIAIQKFESFVALASFYELDVIYYSVSIYGKPYFWYPYSVNSNQIIRWDVP